MGILVALKSVQYRIKGENNAWRFNPADLVDFHKAPDKCLTQHVVNAETKLRSPSSPKPDDLFTAAIAIWSRKTQCSN